MTKKKPTHKEILESKLVDLEKEFENAKATMYQHQGAVIIVKQMIKEADG